jgi:hypothetical protein
VRSPKVHLQVSDLALEGLAPLLVPLQGSVGLGAEVHVACLEMLGDMSVVTSPFKDDDPCAFQC